MDLESKTIEKIEEKSHTKYLTHGWDGIVFYPSDKPGYVLKLSPKEYAKHTMKIMNHLKEKTLEKKCKIEILDQYYLLPNEIFEVKDRKPNLPKKDLLASYDYGTYIKFGGQTWNNEYNQNKLTNAEKLNREISKIDLLRIQHIIKSILYLHQCGITHNDVSANNILIHDQNPLCPKLIDWVWSAIHDPNNDQILGNSIPSNFSRWFRVLFSGRFFHKKREQIEYDWSLLIDVISYPWNIRIDSQNVSVGNRKIVEQVVHTLYNTKTDEGAEQSLKLF